ncbi:MAG TPA: helix-turn-helix transcriptional regulator [Xanthobacteraceae bacterium]|nr:helix-turn-helix transcriptional regulator [Xanthobacteraceae bacterium]
MDISAAVEALTALAQPTRLAAFRRLVKAHPEGVPAGDVARLCAVPHNTMSTHLAALVRAGLASTEKQGRVVSYRADLDGFRTLMNFLTRDCCQGRPEICAPLLADLAGTSRSQRASHA